MKQLIEVNIQDMDEDQSEEICQIVQRIVEAKQSLPGLMTKLKRVKIRNE